MSKRGCNHLAAEIDSILNRFRTEYEMTYVELVGVLECIKADLLLEAQQDDSDDDGDTLDSPEFELV